MLYTSVYLHCRYLVQRAEGPSFMCPFCSFKFHQMQNCRCTQYTYFTSNSFTLNNIVRISSGLHFLHILLNITELNHLRIDSWLGHMTDLLFSFDFIKKRNSHQRRHSTQQNLKLISSAAAFVAGEASCGKYLSIISDSEV